MDVTLSEINPLVDLSLLLETLTCESGVWVESCEVSGDGSTLKDDTLGGLERWELSSENFLLVFLGFLLLFSKNDFLDLDLG